MDISKKGLEFITLVEGLKLDRYKDVAGLWTVGVGHLITGKENPTIGDTITHDRALELLKEDSKIALDSVNTSVKVMLNQNEFDALVSFTFNIGVGAFTKSTLLKKLNSGLRKESAEEFKKWNKAGGRVVQGLVNRRNKEKELFLKGIYDR